MYTSTTFVVESKVMFQTCSMIMARVKRRPALRIMYSSNANSFVVSSIGRPARSTLRSTRFIFRSRTVSTDSEGEFVPINALGGDEAGKVDDHSNCLRFTSRYSAVTRSEEHTSELQSLR